VPFDRRLGLLGVHRGWSIPGRDRRRLAHRLDEKIDSPLMVLRARPTDMAGGKV